MATHEDNISMARACAANSIAPSTKRAVSICLTLVLSRSFLTQKIFPQYTTRWLIWESYCAAHALGYWTATPEDLVAFLQCVWTRTASVTSVNQSLSSIAYHYRLQGEYLAN